MHKKSHSYRIGFSSGPSAMQQLESTAAGVFSLYGVRHIAELPLVVTCKRACVTPIAIFTALVFPSRPSAMRQLESTAAQLLLAVWRPPYDRIIINRYLQASLHSACR